ncbi:hypothetical protein BGX30_005114 [Mortierella sp. GBA39]|nr:hypothetical protein BGX30_005114 [Mortierella sp. GBA39]
MPNTPPNNHSPDNHSPKRSKILRNLHLPWKKKKLPHKLPAQVSLQQHEDSEAAFQDSLQSLQDIHGRHYEHQHRRILSRRSSGITVGTDCHSLMDAHSEFSVLSPRSPVFRYRMLYGPSIENIENIGETHHPDDEYDHHHLFTSEDEFVKEMDKELAQARVHVMKKRNAKQLRLRLSIEGARPGSGSIVSIAPSTPVSVSPGFSQRFSSKVAPSPSPSRHASPKPPPLSRLASFSGLQNHEGPIMLTKKHIEHIRRIENRLQVLENSAPHIASSEPEQQLQKQCQPVVDHTPTPTPVREESTTSCHQQHLRTKPSHIRRVDTPNDFRTHMLRQRRISAIDRTDCQSPTSPSFPEAAASRSFSFHDWGSRWSYTAATAAAAAVTRASRHSHKEPTDRTEQLLEKVKERVASRIRLESALWETEALLRQYETLVVQDWELKLDSLRTNATATAAVAGQEQQKQQQQQQQKQQQHYQQMNERRLRNPQELPCEVN